MKEEDVSKLKVAELKEELRSRELSVSGLKAELAKRLLEAVQSEAQEEKAADAEDAPDEEKGDIAEPEAVADGSKGEVQVPEPAGKADESDVPADAAQQEPKAEPATKQAPKASTEGADLKPKDAEGDLKEKQAASVPSDKKPEAPAAAAAAVSDKKAEAPAPAPVSDEPDGGSKNAVTDATAGTAADTKVEKPSDLPQEPKADKQAAEHPAGDSAPAPSKPHKKQLEWEPAAAAAQPGAPPQFATDAAAAPQVNVLGSVEVAAPLQETAEEELDYEADEVMEQATAPASTKAEAKKEEAPRRLKRPADSDAGRSSKAQKTDESERRKREPIAFKPRDSSASGSGRLAENGQREASADLKRTGSQNEKRSVFERLHSGAGKEASTPRRAPPSREAASRALLITGFVRPFTEPMARQMLSETGEIQGFWMPKIKDRAYLIYATEEEAEATRNAVSGIEWPTGNANSLRPKFVSLEDAERTIKTGQPPEMRMEVSATATAPQPARAAVAAATAAEPARAAPARTGAPLQNGPAAESTKPKDMREILEERRRARDAKRAPAAAAPADARPKPAAPAPEPVAEPEPMEEEEPEPKALEELFRKTETKPWLYWLPITEEQKAEKAARDAAQLPGPPAKAVRQ